MYQIAFKNEIDNFNLYWLDIESELVQEGT